MAGHVTLGGAVYLLAYSFIYAYLFVNIRLLMLSIRVFRDHRQNMVPFQWPQWLVVDAIGAQLRLFSNSTD